MNGNTYRLVLTGASGGLGRAFALELAPHASAMVLTGRDSERLVQLRNDIKQRYPDVYLRLIVGDITKHSVQTQLVDAARTVPQPVNLLINAAGSNDFHE